MNALSIITELTLMKIVIFEKRDLMKSLLRNILVYMAGYTVIHFEHPIIHILQSFIICETPAVRLGSTEFFSQSIVEMIHRDRNHPSVLVWSPANEPWASLEEAHAYFNEIFNFTRPMSAGRSLTYKTYMQFADVISINRYTGWYR